MCPCCRVGRKPLLLGAGTLMAVCQFITGAIFLKQMNGGNMSRPSLIGLMAVICVFVAGFACSWGAPGLAGEWADRPPHGCCACMQHCKDLGADTMQQLLY